MSLGDWIMMVFGFITGGAFGFAAGHQFGRVIGWCAHKQLTDACTDKAKHAESLDGRW
jgi:hypothetical protein